MDEACTRCGQPQGQSEGIDTASGWVCQWCAKGVEQERRRAQIVREDQSLRASRVREQAMSAVPELEGLVATTPTLEGFKVLRYLGAAHAFAIHKQGLLADILGDVGESFDGLSTAYANSFSGLQLSVENRLRAQAIARGGNAVVGAQFNIQFVESLGMLSKDRKLMVSGVGTIVFIERIPG